MNILILFAHPNLQSFNHAILETLTETLQERHHQVRIKDLYRLHFNAILDSHDLARIAHHDIPDDILQEQADITWAQGLVFIYPVWWFGPPAILKGWIERVFTRGFAFDFGANGLQQLLHHEQALIINTLGSDEKIYQQNNWHDLLIRPLSEGTLGYCGVKRITYKAFYDVFAVSQSERHIMLREVKQLALIFE